MAMNEKEDARECCYEEGLECYCEEETLEGFDKETYLKKVKEKLRKRLEKRKLEELKNNLWKQAEKEVCDEMGEEAPVKKVGFRNSIVHEKPRTSEISKEEYEELVSEINKIVRRNTQIIAIFTDKKECDKLAEQCLAGNYVEEFIDNEAKLHTLLDRIQSINISIAHGEEFIGSKFGKPAVRMTE